MKSFNRNILLITSLIILFPAGLLCQEKSFSIKPGEQLPNVLKGGEKHRYIINPGPGKFAYFVLQQDGVDALITVLDPDGNKVQSFDSPNGRKGPEPISLFTGKKGNYTLEVTALEQEGHQGKYILQWEKLEPVGSTPQKQVDQLFAQWNSLSGPGAAVAVEKDGKILFSKGYGSAELEYDVPITPSTVFHIASVSKQFTCFAILLLQEEGKLSVNDDIRKYLPEIPDFGKTITLNNLMHHTSGLRDQWELLAMAGWRLDDNITRAHILNIISHQKELNFNPGDEFVYCNTGFTLLAEIVARVSGQSFPEFTRTRIFEPLKMSNTQFYDDCEKIVRNRAYSYYSDSTGYKKSNLNYSNVGATSLFTTTEDLCRWAMNFENPVAGDRSIIEQMNEQGILNKGDTITYAMGQDLGKYKGLKTAGHGGADAGYRTFLLRFPDEKFSVNVLSNYGSFDAGGMAYKVADIYLKDKEVKEEPKKAAPSADTTSGRKEIEIPEDLLKAYSGLYEVQPGVVLSISAGDRKLFAEAPGLPKTGLTAVSADEFDLQIASARLKFIKDESGKISKMSVTMGGQEISAPRLPDFDRSKMEPELYCGEYRSSELSTSYSFLVEKGKLIARHFRTGDIALTPAKPDVFSGDKWYFGSVEFVRNPDKSIKGIKVSGGRVRGLWFDKVKE